jgi:hypothetical protein
MVETDRWELFYDQQAESCAVEVKVFKNGGQRVVLEVASQPIDD